MYCTVYIVQLEQYFSPLTTGGGHNLKTTIIIILTNKSVSVSSVFSLPSENPKIRHHVVLYHFCFRPVVPKTSSRHVVSQYFRRSVLYNFRYGNLMSAAILFC